MVKMVAQVTSTFNTIFINKFSLTFITIAKYVYIKSTTAYVPSSEMGLSQPLSRQRVCPFPQNRGGAHLLRVRGWGSPNSDDWRKSLALCLLCGYDLSASNCRLVFQMNNKKWCLSGSAFFFVKHSFFDKCSPSFVLYNQENLYEHKLLFL
jgi:hypothetical protein